MPAYFPTYQRGAVVLVTVVLLLVMITLVTLYTGRIQSFEHRIILNSQNQVYAFSAAESGLAEGIAHLQDNKTWPSSNLTGLLSNNHSFSVSAVRQDLMRDNMNMHLFTLSATGGSADGLAQRTIVQQVLMYPLLVNIPAAPLIMLDGLNGNLEFEIVANADGAGDGVALSMWTNALLDQQALSGISCGLQEWNDGACATKAYSKTNAIGNDIVAQSATFPSDLLAHFFNVTQTDYQVLRNKANNIAMNCDSLSPQSTGLIWIDGNCQLLTGLSIGSVLSPIILVVYGGNLTIGDNVEVHGMVLFLKPTSSAFNHAVSFAATSILKGAFISNQAITLNAGILRVIYDSNIFSALLTNPNFMRVAKVPGSWRDF